MWPMSTATKLQTLSDAFSHGEQRCDLVSLDRYVATSFSFDLGIRFGLPSIPQAYYVAQEIRKKLTF